MFWVWRKSRPKRFEKGAKRDWRNALGLAVATDTDYKTKTRRLTDRQAGRPPRQRRPASAVGGVPTRAHFRWSMAPSRGGRPHRRSKGGVFDWPGFPGSGSRAYQDQLAGRSRTPGLCRPSAKIEGGERWNLL